MFSKLYKIHDFIYRDFVNYLYLMTFYHGLIILYFYLFPFEVGKMPVKVFYTINFMGFNTNLFDFTLENIFKTWIALVFILILDMIFLTIMMIEFKKLNLTWKKIFYIEILTLITGFFLPFLRNIMFFLSLNTIQILVTYKIIKNIWFGKYIFITGAIILILRLAFYPIVTIISFIYASRTI